MEISEDFMDEGLKVFDDEVNFVCEKLKVPPKLRYEWDDSWETNLEEIFQNYEEKINHSIKCQHIEAKTDEYLKNISKLFDTSEAFWARLNLDPTNNQGATYVFIDCLKKDDVLAQRHISAPNDLIYSDLKSPERLRVQISKVGKVVIYANTKLDIEIEDAYEIKEGWVDVENEILEKLKESGFFLLTREQMKQPITFEFGKENPLHIGILNGMLDSNLYRSNRSLMLYDFFFSWID